jgi:anti-sigma B factor antagonist
MSHSIRTQSEPDAFVVEVEGDIDAAASDGLDAALRAAIGGAEPHGLVIVDLADANFLDSRSIGLLAEWQARLRVAGGRLALVGTRPEVVRLFSMIGLEEAFDFFDARENALKD